MNCCHKLNKLNDLKHNFILFFICLYVADPATSLASNSIQTAQREEISLFYSLMEKIKMSEFVLLPH